MQVQGDIQEDPGTLIRMSGVKKIRCRDNRLGLSHSAEAPSLFGQRLNSILLMRVEFWYTI